MLKRLVQALAITVAFGGCLYLSSFLALNYFHANKFANDFSVYWRAATQPLEDVYFWTGRFPFPYAPTMLLWVKPLGLIPMWWAYFAFVAVSLVAFVAAFRPYIGNWAMLLSVISVPVTRGLYTGQACALLAAGMMWACASKNRILAGVLFGLVASVKPQLVAMAPLFFVLDRDWEAFFASAATLMVTVVLSVFMFGFERWPEWIASMPHFQSMVVDTNVKNVGVTLALWAERSHLPAMPMMLTGLLLGLAVAWFCRNAQPLEKCAAIAASSLLAVPYALAYDLAPIVPLLALYAMKGRIVAALALSVPYHPFPLLASTLELLANKFAAILRKEDHATQRV